MMNGSVCFNVGGPDLKESISGSPRAFFGSFRFCILNTSTDFTCIFHVMNICFLVQVCLLEGKQF